MKRPVLWCVCAVVALVGSGRGVCLAQSTTDCSDIASDAARLKCYDEQAARQKKKSAPPAAAAATPRPVPPAPPARTQPAPAAAATDFGLDADALRKKQAAANPQAPKARQQIVARVKAVDSRARGALRITLEDGQVWEETQRTGGAPPEVGETVTIKHGMLGSYFMSRSAGLALRVKRID